MKENLVIRALGLPLGGGASVTVDEHGWYTARGPVSGLRGLPDATAAPLVEIDLTSIRERLGDSVYRAAKETGLSHGQITRLEDGHGVAWTAMRSVARYYELSIGELCEWIVEQVESRDGN